jgi:phosphoribosylamine--glycine ligase
MRAEQTPYCGVLYCGLMVDGNQPSVVEFNVRFGDPEAQAVLPLIKSDLGAMLFSAANGSLDSVALKISHQTAVCIVLASAGYPEAYEKGKIIQGLDVIPEPDWFVFQAGTIRSDMQFKTNGGRVLAVTAWADDLEQAIAKAYERIDGIKFEGAYYRHDIGQKGIQRQKNSSMKIKGGR